MKDELQTKLVEIITSIQLGIGKAGDFAVEQLPDIAQQYITFGVISNVFHSVLQLVIAVLFGFVSYKVCTSPHSKNRFGTIRDEYAMTGMILGFMSALVILLFIIGLKETMLVLFAPKVWFLLELANLIK